MYDSFICATWHISTPHNTHINNTCIQVLLARAANQTIIGVERLMHTYDSFIFAIFFWHHDSYQQHLPPGASHVWHDSFICTTHLYVRHDSYYGVATISRLLKTIGLFCKKEPFKRDYIPQTRPTILRSLLIVASTFQHLPPKGFWRAATCIIHMCDMTHSYVWHDSLICVTWLIDTCAMTHINDACHT